MRYTLLAAAAATAALVIPQARAADLPPAVTDQD